jgi:flotillin
MGPLWITVVVAALSLFVFTLAFFAKQYRRCPSDKILVVYGKVGTGQSARCIHGGGTLVVPLIQDYSYLSLIPMTINIPLKNGLSLQNIRIHVPSTFTVGISTEPSIMQNAATSAGAKLRRHRRYGPRDHLWPAASDRRLADD